MPALHVLRVFVDDRGAAGNHLGVVLGAAGLSPTARQEIAAELAYSETVFVDPADRLQIFTPTTELPFAGHPLVGAAWLLARPTLHPPAGPVAVRREGPVTWITAQPAFCPPWAMRREDSPAAVDALLPPDTGNLLHWAFEDEATGRIRARVFAPDLGVPEDPATGSAAIVLCAALGRAIAVRQGEGSRILARPRPGGEVELGGRVVRAADRPWPAPNPAAVAGKRPSLAGPGLPR